ncbi:hypothetical protein P152DRAFT_161167 [Eremomyces bilateralis CBS 781.70]|uniref:Uncharacterized protein n=1 Tax=Eremomyces bilateralis CBS 781.70 TaxID=1392243 RepID=A0A6G1FUK7_9PEZI|nr:uncharacterized protein P152DRAFT_161167 [Eremomyces bilateralis CBS 781.70]KAF1809349.1 hypothetical protein P152DRAFT_161167 [Eremomyces bilateralis CBS 781.70]
MLSSSSASDEKVDVWTAERCEALLLRLLSRLKTLRAEKSNSDINSSKLMLKKDTRAADTLDAKLEEPDWVEPRHLKRGYGNGKRSIRGSAAGPKVLPPPRRSIQRPRLEPCCGKNGTLKGPEQHNSQAVIVAFAAILRETSEHHGNDDTIGQGQNNQSGRTNETPKTGARSLFAIALNRIPYDDHEYEGFDGPCGMYYFLEDQFSSSHGWPGLKAVLRAHSIKLIEEAIRYDFPPATAISSLSSVLGDPNKNSLLNEYESPGISLELLRASHRAGLHDVGMDTFQRCVFPTNNWCPVKGLLAQISLGALESFTGPMCVVYWKTFLKPLLWKSHEPFEAWTALRAILRFSWDIPSSSGEYKLYAHERDELVGSFLAVVKHRMSTLVADSMLFHVNCEKERLQETQQNLEITILDFAGVEWDSLCVPECCMVLAVFCAGLILRILTRRPPPHLFPLPIVELVGLLHQLSNRNGVPMNFLPSFINGIAYDIDLFTSPRWRIPGHRHLATGLLHIAGIQLIEHGKNSDGVTDSGDSGCTIAQSVFLCRLALDLILARSVIRSNKGDDQVLLDVMKRSIQMHPTIATELWTNMDTSETHIATPSTLERRRMEFLSYRWESGVDEWVASTPTRSRKDASTKTTREPPPEQQEPAPISPKPSDIGLSRPIPGLGRARRGSVHDFKAADDIQSPLRKRPKYHDEEGFEFRYGRRSSVQDTKEL